jgi:hypothetical protein
MAFVFCVGGCYGSSLLILLFPRWRKKAHQLRRRLWSLEEQGGCSSHLEEWGSEWTTEL